MLSCGILKKKKNYNKKKKHDVRCVAPVVRTPLSKQHLLSSFFWNATHFRDGLRMDTWRRRNTPDTDEFGLSELITRRRKSRNHISPLWKWKQIKATHLYTTNDRKSEEKKVFKKGKLGFFDFFFPEHHTATGLTQWTIFFFVPLSL